MKRPSRNFSARHSPPSPHVRAGIAAAGCCCCLAICLAINGCAANGGSRDLGPVVASFQGEALYLGQVQKAIPPRSSATDSARYAELYIQNWLRQSVLAMLAEDNMEGIGKAVEHQVAKYRNELMAQAYLSQLVASRLDTVIGHQEVDQFYKANPHMFVAATTRYQFYFVKTEHAETTPQLRERLPMNTPADRQQVEEWARKYASAAKLDDDYSDASALQALQAAFPAHGILRLPARSPVVVNISFGPRGEKAAAFLYIKNIIPAGQPLPLEVVAPKIRRLMLSSRRTALADSLQQHAVDEALRTNEAVLHSPE